MPNERINSLAAFKGFIEKRQIESSDLTLEEALMQWEFENQTPDELEDSLDAIREGIADMKAGRVLPAHEAIQEVRRNLNLPPLP